VLLIRTTIGPSPIHGFGLFALDPVPAGTVIWTFDPVIDQDISEVDLDSYPDHVREYLEHYCEYFPERGTLVLSGDSDRFTNHSDDPNTHKDKPNHPRARVLAARDIEAGEEITADYNEVRSLKWLQLLAAGLVSAGESAPAHALTA